MVSIPKRYLRGGVTLRATVPAVPLLSDEPREPEVKQDQAPVDLPAGHGPGSTTAKHEIIKLHVPMVDSGYFVEILQRAEEVPHHSCALALAPPGRSVRGERANFTRLVFGWLAGAQMPPF